MIPFVFGHCMMTNSLVLWFPCQYPTVNLFPVSCVSSMYLLTLHEEVWLDSECILLIASWLELPTFGLHSSSESDAFLAKVLQAKIAQTVEKVFPLNLTQWRLSGKELVIWLLERKPWGHFLKWSDFATISYFLVAGAAWQPRLEDC